MADRDLLEVFDAVLPRLKPFPVGMVPKSGADELRGHLARTGERRAGLGAFSAGAAAFAGLAWLMAAPWTPLWILAPIVALAGAFGTGAAHQFLKLAFAPRPEQLLPPGTDVATALLEDGLHDRIRLWNADAFFWNEAVAKLRLELIDWRRLRDVPEARDIEWSEGGCLTRAAGLRAEIAGLRAERDGLVARREEIERLLSDLDARLRRLEASEAAPVAALPAPQEPSDDG